jgi:ribosomal protein L11 methyltransferase
VSAAGDGVATDGVAGLLQLECDVDAASGGAAEALLWTFGALGITELPALDSSVVEPLPGETPGFARSRLCALFTPDAPLDALRVMLARDCGVTVADVRSVVDADWVAAWRQHATPLRFGRLHVLPTDATLPADAHAAGPGSAPAAVVRLDAGLAFGTGTHPSTAACLAWLAGADLAGRSVLDYGCGSGILALAARALGAARVVAVDHDVQARLATTANAVRNAAPGGQVPIEVFAPEALPPALQADVVVANIVAGVLGDLAPVLSAHVAAQGRLVLAGVLGSQVAAVAAAYPAFVFDVAHDGDWACLAGRRV